MATLGDQVDFNDRLQRIGADSVANDAARRAVDALREPASLKIRQLLKQTADYLLQIRIPLVDIRGTKKRSWTYEIKPFLMKPRMIEESESSSISVGQGWVIGRVGGEYFWPVYNISGDRPVYLTTSGELVGGHEALERINGPDHEILRPPKFIPDAPSDIVPIYDDLSRFKLGIFSFSYEKHLPKRRAFGVSQDGRPIFIKFQPHHDYGSPWSGQWLDDFLAEVVSALIQNAKSKHDER